LLSSLTEGILPSLSFLFIPLASSSLFLYIPFMEMPQNLKAGGSPIFSYKSSSEPPYKRIEGRKGRKGKEREGKKVREGKGREGKGREGKGREGKGREGKIKEIGQEERRAIPAIVQDTQDIIR
jgi:hypothetical protein